MYLTNRGNQIKPTKKCKGYNRNYKVRSSIWKVRLFQWNSRTCRFSRICSDCWSKLSAIILSLGSSKGIISMLLIIQISRISGVKSHHIEGKHKSYNFPNYHNAFNKQVNKWCQQNHKVSKLNRVEFQSAKFKLNDRVWFISFNLMAFKVNHIPTTSSKKSMISLIWIIGFKRACKPDNNRPINMLIKYCQQHSKDMISKWGNLPNKNKESKLITTFYINLYSVMMVWLLLLRIINFPSNNLLLK